MNKKKVLKRSLITLGTLAGLFLVAAAAYVIYLQVNYYRIDDGVALSIENAQTATLQLGKDYTAATFNIGFGAYDHDFSFFMDTGIMTDGTPVSGRYGKAQSEQIVRSNIQGVAGDMALLGADFYLLQEVDDDSTRSFHVNQRKLIENWYPFHASTYASNFHSSYLAYPLGDMHGRASSGLLTLSRYAISESVRRSYPVDESFVTKFFDLDRCFSLQRLPTDSGKELVLINSHMSAYDQGGLVRQAQMDFLAKILSQEAEQKNYVIVGGDFNQTLTVSTDAFPSQQQVPSWVYPFANESLPEGYQVVAADNADQVPTCRSTDLPYVNGVNYTAIFDGFIISQNITATVENVDLDFQNSDHNPVVLTFTLENPS